MNTTKNIGELGLFLPFVSPIQILHDLTDCLTTVNTKIAKRLARLKVVCKCVGIDADQYISHLVIQKEIGVNISADEIEEYCLRAKINNTEEIVTLNNSPKDETVKKAIEAALTSSLNSDTLLYSQACIISNIFVERVRHHSVFGPLFNDKRIIFVYKGGIAQRISLLSVYPQYSEDIKKVFGYGGDNDCTFLVDPQLPNYTAIRQLLVDYIHHCMLEYATRFSDIVREKSESITSVKVGKNLVNVEAIVRENFKLYNSPIQGGDTSPRSISLEFDTYSKPDVVYTTSNDTLKFTDQIGRLCSFTLLRYKKAYQVGNRVIGAELLDISIPHREETKASETFHHFYSGQWIKFINV